MILKNQSFVSLIRCCRVIAFAVALPGAVFAVTDVADLSISKSSSSDNVLTGEMLSYTITVVNNGPARASGIQVLDALPSGMAFLAASGTGWQCALDGSLFCNLGGMLDVGQASTLIVNARAPQTPGTYVNSARVRANQNDPDLGNNSAQAMVEVIAAVRDLSIRMSTDIGTVQIGQNLNYLLSIANEGNVPIAQAEMVNRLPAGMSVVELASANWSCSHSGDTVRCQLMDELAPGSVQTVLIQVLAEGMAGIAINTANLIVVGDAEPGNNTASVSVLVNTSPSADLALDISDAVDPVPAGGEIAYRLQVTNNGPMAATGVVVRDQLPERIRLLEVGGPGWQCESSGSGEIVCSLGMPLAAGQSSVINLRTRAPVRPVQVQNVASVTADQLDPNPSNNQDMETTSVEGTPDRDQLRDRLSDVASPGINPAARQMIPAIAGACARDEADTEALCDALNDAIDSGDRSALQSLLLAVSPRAITGQARSLVEVSTAQARNVGTRIAELQRFSSGLSLTGLNLTYGSQNFPLSLLQMLAAGDDAVDPENLVSPWGFFINGTISAGDRERTAREWGFDFESTGVTAGVDYRFNQDLVAGMALGYADFGSDVDDGGALDTKSWTVTGYASYYPRENFFVDGRLSMALLKLNQSRGIRFDIGPITIDRFATSETDSDQFSAIANMGYHYRRNAWTLTPSMGVTYMNAKVDGFSEQGAAAFNAIVSDYEVSSLQYDVGFSLSKSISLSGGVLVPQFDMRYKYETSHDGIFIQTRLESAPTDEFFSVETEQPDRRFGNAAVGLQYVSSGGKQFYLSYRSLLGLDGFTRYTVNLGARFEF